jgi:hypothetical protein
MQQDQQKDSQTESLKKEIETKNEELISLGPPVTCPKGEHSFKSDGMEMGLLRVKCINCPLGYFIPIGGSLKDGHIYLKGAFVI